MRHSSRSRQAAGGHQGQRAIRACRSPLNSGWTDTWGPESVWKEDRGEGREEGEAGREEKTGSVMSPTDSLFCPWDSPRKSTGVDSHSFLQGIFPTQGSGRFFTGWAGRMKKVLRGSSQTKERNVAGWRKCWGGQVRQKQQAPGSGKTQGLWLLGLELLLGPDNEVKSSSLLSWGDENWQGPERDSRPHFKRVFSVGGKRARHEQEEGQGRGFLLHF